jgi:hypothetical protein
MNGYGIIDPGVVLFLALLGMALLLAGYAVISAAPERVRFGLAWGVAIGGVAAANVISRHERFGFRMLALVAVLFVGMKLVVYAAGGRGVPFGQWIKFACCWLGMRPDVFSRDTRRPGARTEEAAHMMLRGGVRAVVGGLIMVLASPVWRACSILGTPVATAIGTVVLLVGYSLAVHFGVMELAAGYWRRRGYIGCRLLFREPWKATSLREFWGSRWNLAFSEMTSLAIVRPISARVGPGLSVLAGFVASGLLHEVAISLPVHAGFGLPTAYFVLQGILVLAEERLLRLGWLSGLPSTIRRLATLLCVIAPAPLVLHHAFLAGVVWPLFHA